MPAILFNLLSVEGIKIDVWFDFKSLGCMLVECVSLVRMMTG